MLRKQANQRSALPGGRASAPGGGLSTSNGVPSSVPSVGLADHESGVSGLSASPEAKESPLQPSITSAGSTGSSAPEAPEEDKQCGICYEDITQRGELDSCRHLFCFACIHRWSNIANTCPMCKTRFRSITKRDLLAAGTAPAPAAQRKRGRGKKAAGIEKVKVRRRDAHFVDDDHGPVRFASFASPLEGFLRFFVQAAGQPQHRPPAVVDLLEDDDPDGGSFDDEGNSEDFGLGLDDPMWNFSAVPAGPPAPRGPSAPRGPPPVIDLTQDSPAPPAPAPRTTEVLIDLTQGDEAVVQTRRVDEGSSANNAPRHARGARARGHQRHDAYAMPPIQLNFNGVAPHIGIFNVLAADDDSWHRSGSARPLRPRGPADVPTFNLTD